MRIPMSRFLAVALTSSLAALVPLSAQPPEVTWVEGPATVDLGKDLAQIELPAGFLFADAEDTRKLMEANGNPPSHREAGLIAPAGEADWFVVFEYSDVGYIKDGDGDKIDADGILKSIREGTEAANKERQERGFTPLHVVGWFEKPHYDKATHNLVWAIEARDDGSGSVVNYDVRLLGRRGYMSATLVTDPQSLATHLPAVRQLLDGFSYKAGNRYAEFVQGDKVAEYGLVALVAGGAGAAAAKAGLFAALGKMLAKGWKLVVAGLVAVAAGLRKIFGNRSAEQPSGLS